MDNTETSSWAYETVFGDLLILAYRPSHESLLINIVRYIDLSAFEELRSRVAPSHESSFNDKYVP